MGRRARGILLQDAQARAGERQGLQDKGGGETGRIQVELTIFWSLGLKVFATHADRHWR